MYLKLRKLDAPSVKYRSKVHGGRPFIVNTTYNNEQIYLNNNVQKRTNNVQRTTYDVRLISQSFFILGRGAIIYERKPEGTKKSENNKIKVIVLVFRNAK